MSEQQSDLGSIELPAAISAPIGDLGPKRDDRSRSNQWVVLAAFLIGIVFGAFGFAAYNIFTSAQVNNASILREAARNGFMDGIATLQAGGSAAASSGSSGDVESTAPVTTTFQTREANRLGDKNAKVVFIEFADFQCPYCERWYQQVEPQIIRQYVQSGQVTFVYKHLAFLGQESEWAGEASECAADQNKFWEYHNLLFQKQNGENQGAFTKDKLIAFAQSLELDMAKFTPCLTNDETLDRVRADTEEGKQVRATGTPTFFINGVRIVGSQPYGTYQAAIDKALAQ
jgi:protein-disulfide isomerase